MLAALRATRYRVILVAAIAALLVSCTFTRFAYNQADTLSVWMADEYFSLDGTQKDEFNKRFERLYTWHRYEQLPDYAQFRRTAHGRMQYGLSQ